MKLNPTRSAIRTLTFLFVFCITLDSSGSVTRKTPTNIWNSICWHDVRDDVENGVDLDQHAVSTESLTHTFDWLLANNWHPVTIDQIISAHEGRSSLPERAVLLTFDDSLQSLYDRVFPLLRAYNYPAVAAIVTSWIEKSSTEYGDISKEPTPEMGEYDSVRHYIDWSNIREMLESGLIEVASHTHDHHKGILGNPQGNEQPAITTYKYLTGEKRYETEDQWKERVQSDLEISANILQEKTGVRPRSIIWPFGRYNSKAEMIAQDLGMVVSLGLTAGENTTEKLGHHHRLLITANPNLSQLTRFFPPGKRKEIIRAAQVDLDYLYDEDPKQQGRNLDALLDRIKELGINTVYLQAFADPEGDGTASALYFPNKHLPMRVDLFNRVSWQLHTRANVSVYAWMPVLSFDLSDREMEWSSP